MCAALTSAKRLREKAGLEFCAPACDTLFPSLCLVSRLFHGDAHFSQPFFFLLAKLVGMVAALHRNWHDERLAGLIKLINQIRQHTKILLL